MGWFAKGRPRIGDRVWATGSVERREALGGEPGALVRFSPRLAPVWIPLADLLPASRTLSWAPVTTNEE